MCIKTINKFIVKNWLKLGLCNILHNNFICKKFLKSQEYIGGISKVEFGKSSDPGVNSPGLMFLLWNQRAVWQWANPLVSASLSFFICKVRSDVKGGWWEVALANFYVAFQLCLFTY